MCLSMEQKVCGSSPEQVKSNTMLLTAYHCYNVSLTNAVLCGNNKLITRYGVIQPEQSKSDLIFDIILERDPIDLLQICHARNSQRRFERRSLVQSVGF